uniref:MARVEL domain-containing protein n=1 Tax=Alexandrium catenella TaxID=2925 RepID=A0A7S1RY32_ALECA|mmetsp:Transcript_78264/g.207708  ORF Transcript_78264/g.207708 Transcript_78264/m.207708 type:complete len:177 (+) Transcript_78264:82-612(+)
MREQERVSLAVPASDCCCCIDLHLATLAIGFFNLLMSLHHSGQVKHNVSNVQRVVACLLASLEVACGSLLLVFFLAGRSYKFLRLGYYVAVIMAIAETLNLFILVPIAMAVDPTMIDRMAESAGSCVFGTVIDVYFAYIIWSLTRQLRLLGLDSPAPPAAGSAGVMELQTRGAGDA